MGETVPNEYVYYSAVESGYKEPKTFKAMMRLKEEEHNNWLKGVDKELKNLEKRQVWIRIKISDMPLNRKLIGTK